ncbi:MAG: sigma-70 family RNA polymerase sigma factor [Candidatus Buchananbacteria bacterium]|jgi:RNA polymerase sigma-70 factor (ECF subfamily)
MKESTDEQLVKAYLAGERNALEILIKRYLKQIFGFAFSYVKSEAAAEDITQETFIKAWRKIKKFDTEKQFKSWIFTIAKNTALDHLKKRHALTFSALDPASGEGFLLGTIADKSLRPDELFDLYESDNWFEATIVKLSDKYRQVVIMRQNDQSFREIAQHLGEPLHTVKSRYRRALIQLKNNLG